MRNVFGHIAPPALSCVDGDHPQWRRILAAQDIVDDGRLIRFVLVGFDIRAAQASEVIQHKMNRDVWLAGASGVWVRITFTPQYQSTRRKRSVFREDLEDFRALRAFSSLESASIAELLYHAGLQ